MLNSVHYIGRLVETPELRHTKADEIPVTSFRLAVQRDFVRKGEEADTDFFDITAWRSTAEFICKNFEKGKLICLRGRNQNRQWKDKHEQNRVTTELIVDQAYFVGDKAPGDNTGTLPDPFEEEYPFTGEMPAPPQVSPFDD